MAHLDFHDDDAEDADLCFFASVDLCAPRGLDRAAWLEGWPDYHPRDEYPNSVAPLFVHRLPPIVESERAARNEAKDGEEANGPSEPMDGAAVQGFAKDVRPDAGAHAEEALRRPAADPDGCVKIESVVEDRQSVREAETNAAPTPGSVRHE